VFVHKSPIFFDIFFHKLFSILMGAALAPTFSPKRASAPGRPLNSGLVASGFLAILPSLAASLRQPCKNGKNHSPQTPHFRLRPCPALWISCLSYIPLPWLKPCANNAGMPTALACPSMGVNMVGGSNKGAVRKVTQGLKNAKNTII
jgi:hypothetical protein